MAERKVEVEINGKKLRVSEHMVEDIMKFGATMTKREIKNPPKELTMPLPKKVVIPAKPIEAVAKPTEALPDPQAIKLAPELKTRKPRTKK